MDRRAFLSIVAGSPLVFGLRELLAQDPAPEKSVPEWYRAALKRMKETRRYGIVFIVPADAKERNRWGRALAARSNDGLMIESIARLAVVFICITPELSTACLGEAAGKENRILLDPDGKRLSSDVMGVEVLEHHKDFDPSIRDLVWPKNNMDRLKGRAAELDKGIKDSTRKATADLSTNTGPYPHESAKALLEEADAIMPWIVSKWYEANLAARDERGVILRMVHLWPFLVSYWISQLSKVDDPNLPYGVHVESVPHDTCPTCGLHARPMRVRRFLEFFEK